MKLQMMSLALLLMMGHAQAATPENPTVSCTGRTTAGKKVTVNFFEDTRWGFDKGRITVTVGAFKLEYDVTRTANPANCDDEYTATYQANKRKNIRLVISEDPARGMSWITAIEEKGIKLSCKY